MKVRIKSLGLPKAAYGQQVDYGLSLGRGMDENSTGSLKPKRTIGGVPREEANLEAEGGETVVGQISGDGIVDHMTIKGPRHSSGGVPMNLPDDSFIFSDTKSMKIKDPKILQMFGKTKGSYTPAELAKPYDISKYKAILMDPDTDRLSRNTAEIMIKNIVMKLGALALAQEAKKGFPQGIPEIAKPYMEANGITEEDLIPELKAQAEQMQAMQMQQAQAMQQQPQAPQGMPPMMPDGQPVAMPQQGMAPPEQPMMDPRQMMAMQQEQQMMPPQMEQPMPMAAYGMELGGYDMPFVMANGGLTKYQDAGETVEGRRAEKVDRLPGTGTRGRTDSDRFESETTITPGEERKNASEARSSGRPSSSGWEGAICDMIKDGATWEQLTDPDVAFEKTGSRKTHLNPNSPQAQEIWERCKGDQSRFEETIEDVYVEVEETEENNGCQCEKDGVVSNKMTFEEILASGRIEGYTVEQRCTGFKEAFCREEFEEEIQQKKKSDPLALPPMSSMRRRLATPDPVGLDIVPTPKTNYLDYRTAVQNQQSNQLAQINDIRNMSGLTEGQKQAMIAKVNAASTGPIASTVTDVYNKNAMLGAARYKDETALGMNQQKMRAGLDADYNRAVANTKNLETAGINQIRANRDQRAMDVYKMNVMKQSLENAAENYDWLGNFLGGTNLQRRSLSACIGAGNDPAKCLAKYYPNVDPTTMGQAPTTTTTTPDPDGTPDPNATPDPDGGSSRYGGSVNSSTFIPRYSTLPYGN
tara:strand:+ start:12435 stop:14702 length:2268 start_codon:yes stop_codon:yes gene_type:complete